MKLHLICSNDDLRPAMTYVQLKKGFFIATDAHMLIKVHKSQYEVGELFEEDEEIYIEREQWKNLIGLTSLKRTDGMISGIKGKAQKFCAYLTAEQFAEDIGRYPDIEVVIKYDLTDNSPVINWIGLNLESAAKIQTALGIEQCFVKFFGRRSHVQIFDATGEVNGFGLIMPLEVSDTFIGYPSKERALETA